MLTSLYRTASCRPLADTSSEYLTAMIETGRKKQKQKRHIIMEEEWEFERSLKDLSRQEFFKGRYGGYTSSSKKRKSKSNKTESQETHKRNNREKRGVKWIIHRGMKENISNLDGVFWTIKIFFKTKINRILLNHLSGVSSVVNLLKSSWDFVLFYWSHLGILFRSVNLLKSLLRGRQEL